jgi:hypothetical protein
MGSSKRDQLLISKLTVVCRDIDELTEDGDISLAERRAWLAVRNSIRIVISELKK